MFVEFGNDRHFLNMIAALDTEEWTEDPRLNTVDARNENRSYVHETVQETFQNVTTDEILQLLLDADVPAARVNTVPEAIDDPQLQHRGTVTSIESEGEEVVIAGRPIHFSGYDIELESPPDLAEHTEEILVELGFDDSEIRHLIESEITPMG